MTNLEWFAFVGMPAILMLGGWLTLKWHERWLDRELARERGTAAK